MHWVQAAVLGVVEGLTEFLPVSSTGHLILAERAMGIGEDPANTAFAILVQFGAIVAVVGLFWQRVLSVLRGLVGRDRDGLRLGVNLVLGLVPAGIVGLFYGQGIQHMLFNLWVVTAAWALGGVAIVILSRKRARIAPTAGRAIESLTALQAFLIGVFQVVALWPGISRSLATIVGGLVVGLSLGAAVEYSFLLGVVTLTAATAKEALGTGRVMIDSLGQLTFAIGIVTAAISAAFAVKWMIAYLTRRPLEVFGWYRLGLAVLTVVLLATGVIQAA